MTTIRCAYGHEWTARTDNVACRKSWCPHCRDLRRGFPQFAEMCSEYGFEAVEGGDASLRTYRTASGVETTISPVYFRTSPPVDKENGYYIVRSFEKDGVNLYTLGKIPARLPAYIVKFMRGAEVKTVLKDTSRTIAAELFRGLIEGTKQPCLNVLYNKQWKLPGQYDWGKVETFHGTLVSTKAADEVWELIAGLQELDVETCTDDDIEDLNRKIRTIRAVVT